MQINDLKTNENELIIGPKLFTPSKFKDNRGYFFESWNKNSFDKALSREVVFVQDNISFSMKGVLRGLHYQKKPFSQGKLVRCSSGSIYDVALDIRNNSKTFGKWVGVILSANNEKSFWIPEGFAHGFLALEDNTKVNYKVNNYWNSDYERSINWKDDFININWNTGSFEIFKPILSKKDESAPSFRQALQNQDFL